MIVINYLFIVPIELSKAKGHQPKEDLLNLWLNFINYPEVILDMESKAIKQARNVLEEISQDKREQRLTELRQKYIMDQKAIEDLGYDKGLEKGMQRGLERGLEQGMKRGLEQGLEQGMQRGLEQGIQQGKKQNKLEMAKKMKFKKIQISVIQEITGLTREEIEKL